MRRSIGTFGTLLSTTHRFSVSSRIGECGVTIHGRRDMARNRRPSLERVHNELGGAMPLRAGRTSVVGPYARRDRAARAAVPYRPTDSSGSFHAFASSANTNGASFVVSFTQCS